MIHVFLMLLIHLFLSTVRFKSSVLFGTHTLLDKSLRVLEFPTHFSNLTENG